MKNRISFHLYNAILMLGLILVFHTPHIKTSVDYFNGEALLITSSHFVFPTESPVSLDMAYKDAICTVVELTHKVPWITKHLSSTPLTSLNPTLDVKPKHIFFEKPLTRFYLYLTNHILRL